MLLTPTKGMRRKSLSIDNSRPVKTARMIENEAARICDFDTLLNKGVCFGVKMSMMESMPRLNAQLPNISPTAKSADSTMADELIPTINSGSEVTKDINIKTIQALLKPEYSEIKSL